MLYERHVIRIFLVVFRDSIVGRLLGEFVGSFSGVYWDFTERILGGLCAGQAGIKIQI